MRRLDTATADRWLGTVVPAWPRTFVLPFVCFKGFSAWLDAADASWLVMVACLGAVLLQLMAPRFGCLLGVGCGVLAVVVERDEGVRNHWVGLALACLALLVWHEVARARQRTISRSLSREGLGVRVAFDEDERLAIFTDDEQEPRLVAFVEVDDPPELEDLLAAAPDDDKHKERITAGYLRRFAGPAVLKADLVEGARPEFVTGAGRLHASGRLQARSKHETFEPLPQVEVPDVPAVPDDVKLPQLPWRPKQLNGPSRGTLIFFGLIGAAATGKIVHGLDTRTMGSTGALAILAGLIVPVIVIDELCRRVVIDQDGVRVRSQLLDRTIPWSRVRDIRRRSGGEIVLDLSPAQRLPVGLRRVLGDDRRQVLSFDDEDGQHVDDADRPSSRQALAVLRTLRAQASAGAGRSSMRLSWGAYASAAYVAALAVAVVAFVLPRL